MRGGIVRSGNVPVCIAASHAPSAYFIANAPADIAWLLAEVQRLRGDEPVAQDVTKWQGD